MKVAIVNDSRVAVEVLRRILASQPGFELSWVAYSGEEAITLAASDRPDILLMDLIMPGLDGAETTRRIMKATPCVILVVTATTAGNRDKVFEAMGHGALDAVNTPTLGLSGDMAGAEPLLQKLRMVARLVHPPRAAPTPANLPPLVPSSDASQLPIVAIGASTGGPQALAEILSHLPERFPAAILVSQHVDVQFAPGLAAWLQHHTPLPVHIAKNHERITGGAVWIAGTPDHMAYIQLEHGHAGLTYLAEPRDTSYRPSVDVLFNSLAQGRHTTRIGVLLTGMGRDGAEGLLSLRQGGHLTIAQDAESCVVYGMPRAAAELKAAAEILPLTAIGPRIRNAILHTTPRPITTHPESQRTPPR